MRVLILASCLLAPVFARANAQCLGDFNGDGRVTVDELITAVDNVLNGCQVAPPRFVDNGDGTVTDHKTGLMWEKKQSLDGTPNTDNPHDADNTYGWSVTAAGLVPSSDTLPDGTAFTVFLGALNNGALILSSAGTTITETITGCFAGHCDWRLPSLLELGEIVDSTAPGCGAGDPCIDPVFGPTLAGYYWSSTSWADDTSGESSALAIAVDFSVPFNGFWQGNNKSVYALCVRAVRGSSAAGTGVFVQPGSAR
jgi:hypothetical protein